MHLYVSIYKKTINIALYIFFVSLVFFLIFKHLKKKMFIKLFKNKWINVLLIIVVTEKYYKEANYSLQWIIILNLTLNYYFNKCNI